MRKQVNVKSILRKRWVLPAVYLVAAAGVLSTVFFMQSGDETTAPEDSVEVEGHAGMDMTPYGEDAVSVTASKEVLKMPVEKEENVNVVGYFYDVNATAEEQQEALVYFNNTYYPNKGMDFAHVEGEKFNVTASLSGTVERVEKDAILGYVVELNHEDGIVTHYHSLGSVEVEEGESVKQGQVLGEAGRNQYNEDAGIHVHFEVRQDGISVNPNDIFQQPIDSIKDAAEDEEG